MADQNEDPSSEREEKKIPVFTVLKNNSILKNIFLLDKPLSISDSNGNGHVSNQEVEEMLLVGRHPDCNIKLEHPSISRHHLQIYSKPSSLDLSVVDLSSVHGTWISGEKIAPGVRVHLKEGNSMQLGGSSRVYRLHWVPLSRAYDLDDPFVPLIEEQVVESVDGIVEETHEEEEYISGENNQIQLIGDGLGSSRLSLSNKNLKSCLKKVSLSEPRVLEFQQDSDGDDDEFRGFYAPLEEVSQEEDIMSRRNNEIQSMRDELGSSKLSLSNKNLKSCLKKVSLSEPQVLEFQQASFVDDDDEFQRFNALVEEIIAETPQEEDSISPKNNKIQSMRDELGCSILSLSNKNLKSCLSSSEPRVLEFQQASSDDDDDDELQDSYALRVKELLQGEDSMSPGINKIQSMRDEIGSLKLSLSNKNLKSCSSPSEPRVLEFQQASSDDDDELQDYYALGIEEILQEADSKSPGNNQIQHDECGSSKLSVSSKHLKSCLEKVCSSPLSVQELRHFSSDDDDELLLNVENQIPEPSFVLENPQIKEQYFMSCEDNQFQLMGTELESLDSSFPKNNLKFCLKKVSTDNNDVLQELNVENEIPDPEPPVVLENAQVLKHSPVNENKVELCSSEMESEQTKISSLIRGLFFRKSQDQSNSAEENFSVKYSSESDSESEQTEISRVIRALFFRETSSPVSSIVSSISEDESNSNEENSTVKNSKEPDSKNLSITEYHSQEEDSQEQSWSSNIWSRRGKLTTAQIDLFDTTSNKSISNVLLDEDAEDNFTPDKENFTPKTLRQRSTKNKNKLEELKSFEKSRNEQDLVKRNRVVTRVPFKSLVAKSTSTEKSDNGGKTKKWVMVVDTSCLLNKKSRKSIKLLLGLKGTQLVIPQIVLSELESKKQQRRFFRRETESCSALKWIEESMMKNETKQWIHVQSSSEDGSFLAPTPTTLSPASACGSLLEILSSASQDHALECALTLKRTKNDGQQHVVLLSNDVTMKIKAMAEGLLCERAEEFREKLVNPSSERFLWGPTLLCKNGVLKGEEAGAIKGLKLILLDSKHNTC